MSRAATAARVGRRRRQLCLAWLLVAAIAPLAVSAPPAGAFNPNPPSPSSKRAKRSPSSSSLCSRDAQEAALQAARAAPQRWMRVLSDEACVDLGAKSLQDVTIVGAHDAGAYYLTLEVADCGLVCMSCKQKIVKCQLWGIAQAHDLKGQFQSGVRYFDLRVTYDAKAEECGAKKGGGVAACWRLWHSLLGHPVGVALRDLRDALREDDADPEGGAEVVIVMMKLEYYAHPKSPSVTIARIHTLLAELDLVLGDYLFVDQRKHWWTIPLNEIVSSGKRIILILEASDKHIQNLIPLHAQSIGQGVLKDGIRPKGSAIAGKFSNMCCNPADIAASQEQELNRYSELYLLSVKEPRWDRPLLRLYWTMTFSITSFLLDGNKKKVNSLRQAAMNVNRYLPEFFARPDRPRAFGNIIMGDFLGDKDLPNYHLDVALNNTVLNKWGAMPDDVMSPTRPVLDPGHPSVNWPLIQQLSFGIGCCAILLAAILHRRRRFARQAAALAEFRLSHLKVIAPRDDGDRDLESRRSGRCAGAEMELSEKLAPSSRRSSAAAPHDYLRPDRPPQWQPAYGAGRRVSTASSTATARPSWHENLPGLSVKAAAEHSPEDMQAASMKPGSGPSDLHSDFGFNARARARSPSPAPPTSADGSSCTGVAPTSVASSAGASASCASTGAAGGAVSSTLLEPPRRGRPQEFGLGGVSGSSARTPSPRGQQMPMPPHPLTHSRTRSLPNTMQPTALPNAMQPTLSQPPVTMQWTAGRQTGWAAPRGAVGEWQTQTYWRSP